MKCLTTKEANFYLSRIGMEIGGWNQLTEINKGGDGEVYGMNYQAPLNARELFNFSEHVAGWLPKGDWKILQFDNSGGLDAVQATLFRRLLLGSDETLNLNENRTFLFEFGDNEKYNENTELLLSSLISLLLIFESHGYLVSSNRSAGKYLAIQDGFVYFYSNDKSLSEAKLLLMNFEKNPLMSCQWVTQIIVNSQ